MVGQYKHRNHKTIQLSKQITITKRYTRSEIKNKPKTPKSISTQKA